MTLGRQQSAGARPRFTFLENITLAAIRRSWTFQQRLNTTASTRLETRDFIIPIRSGIGLDMLTIYPQEHRYVGLLRSLLTNRPGAIVDVGANIGRFLLMCAATRMARPYVGFEIHTTAANYVDQLIRANDLKDYAIFPIGLSDTHQVVQIQTNGQHDVMATTVQGHYAENHFSETYPVLVDTGDRILHSLPLEPVALIKVDVEGGELEVVRGLTQTIQRDHPVLILEVTPYQHVLDNGEVERAAFRKNRIAKLETWLIQNGYTFAKIEDGDKLCPVTTLDPGTSRDTDEMDYVCIPKNASLLSVQISS